MKYIWHLIGFVTIILILINNPKSPTLGNPINQATPVNFTKSAKNNLQISTIFSVIAYLVLTVLMNIYSY
uniref:Probable protein-export membrane protein SecG n=2 Tax=Gelidium TaxID=2811 RepID=A0A411FS15_9FLOR|nr:preprotein translocase subunit G [Gelidium kathyanniae]YP_009564991.1 preprotein translocase subunit G [Gelidium galapagense]AYO27847.1 preprotein translocase subunit G [Gelidium kathyanniae]QBA96342.1 preprotein translocase subunit G [Gelidium galapagense]